MGNQSDIIINERVKKLIGLADELQIEATASNVVNVFDDGGFRELVLCEMFNLKKEPGRHGDDGYDDVTGEKYELKTANFIDTSGKLKRTPGITTSHHLSMEIISRYRNVKSILVGIFYLHQPARIYEIAPQELEEIYFKKWENQLSTKDHLNNPKIAFTKITKNPKSKLRYQNPKYDHLFNPVPRVSMAGKKGNKQEEQLSLIIEP